MDTETKRNLIILALFLTGLLIMSGSEKKSWLPTVVGAILFGGCYVITLLCLP